MNPTDRLAKKAATAKKPAAALPLDPIAISPPGGQPVLTPVEGRVTELRMAASDYVQRAIGCDLDDSEESLAFVDHYVNSVRSGGVLRDEVLELVAVALGVYLGEVTRTKFGGRWVALPPEPSTLPVRPIGQATTEHPTEHQAGQPAGRLADRAVEGLADRQAGETPILDSIDDPVGWRLQLLVVPLLVDPIGMALRALRRPESGAALPTESEPESESDDGQLAGAASPDPLGGEDPVGFATTPALTASLRAALARLPPVSIDYYFSLTGRFETLTYVVELLAEMQHQEAEKNAAPPDPETDPETDPDSDL